MDRSAPIAVLRRRRAKMSSPRPIRATPSADAEEHGQALDQDPTNGQADPDQDPEQADDRRAAPGGLGRGHLEVDLDLALEQPLELRDAAGKGRQAADGLAQDGQRLARGMGGGQHGELLGDRHRLGVAVGPVGRGVALGAQLLGLARLLEHRLALGQVCGGGRLRRFRLDRRGPIRGQAGERPVGRSDEGGRPVDGRLGHPDPARIALAPILEIGQGGADRRRGSRRARIGGRDRRGQTVAHGGVARDPGQLGVPNEGRRPEEGGAGQAGQLDEAGVHRGRIGDRGAVQGEHGGDAGRAPGPAHLAGLDPGSIGSPRPARPAVSTLKSMITVGAASAAALHERSWRPSSRRPA